MALLENKLNITASYGVQHSNISEIRSTNNTRKIGSVKLVAKPTRGLVFSINFSNYQYDQNQNTNVILDSLLVRRVSKQFKGSVRYSFRKDKTNHFIRLSYHQREIDASTQNRLVSFGAKNYVVNYKYDERNIGLSISPGINIVRTNAFQKNIDRITPSVLVRKEFLHRALTVDYKISYTEEKRNEMLNNKIWRHRISLRYKLNRDVYIFMQSNIVRSEQPLFSAFGNNEALSMIRLTYKL